MVSLRDSKCDSAFKGVLPIVPVLNPTRATMDWTRPVSGIPGRWQLAPNQMTGKSQQIFGNSSVNGDLKLNAYFLW
jgi:hypothetical protein